ncbi:transcriptional regulator NrdR [Fundicoccus culcitae]|uniref:Transcriptional repressor NrdR n=1 Tax=Fundicoccus culcitae TaxID=2969821 RepID=A0ABY5P621_9LACT|nr:transcriptional regulator NrdR [Fundicoccus culcitae]UUX34167.1 transcriptional regulator NrdR [Fundicoccus culcitae]
MECPKCRHQQSKVIDSRPADDGASIRRRRECLKCGTRFNTYERVEKAPLLVIKRDGTREEFNRDKLLRGIIRAAEKRPISREQMDQLVTDVENAVREESDTEIASERIGEFIMPRLMEIDEVAYIRFASVYRQFQSRDMFIKELEAMNHTQKDTDSDIELDKNEAETE